MIFSRSEFGKQSDYVLAIGCDMGASGRTHESLNVRINIRKKPTFVVFYASHPLILSIIVLNT
jgi:hypothetical protein